MITTIVECLAGAVKAKGLVVVIDVFRSATVGCYLMEKGVGEYLAAETLEQARELTADRGGLLIGEQQGVPLEEFDLGNSPTLLMEEDLSGKTLVHSTNAGIPGLFACADADEVITGSFVNAGAVVRYIRSRNPERVTLVSIGTGGDMRAQEDMMCAIYIKNELEGYPNSFETLRKFLAKVDTAAMFYDESRVDAPEGDFEMCMDIDRYDFILKGERMEGGGMLMRKVDVEKGEGA
ncbi:MAG: 2-phosphosulfolactate phosphatase [Desulfovibrionaceae bacterium]|nr:2-phosphosulfolactate phosphatase [Desulfovibrionaceae bacterium]